MKNTKRVGLFLFMSIALLSQKSLVWGEQVYDFDVIAKTGISIGNGTPVALGTGPSINDVGKVAFIARDSADPGDGRVILLNNGVIERDCTVGVLAMVSDAVQANNSDKVVFRMRSDDNLFSDIVRLDTSCSGPILGRGSYSSSAPQPFDVVLPPPTLNSGGRGVFGADIGSNTMLGSRADGTGPYNVSPSLTGSPNLPPMFADNDIANFIADATNQNRRLRCI